MIYMIENNPNYLNYYLIKYLNSLADYNKFIPYVNFYAESVYEVLTKYYKDNVQTNLIIQENEKEKGLVVKKSRIYRGLE